ncbi:MAG: hypothetical protein PHI12_14445 [Dehalococcoidales bacterium]|jgi:transcriptional regulator with XRE-family HTH domain|nr:hypothetical protein [Dehalococcoidales bacterium]
MAKDILVVARKALRDRVLQASPEELEGFQKTDLAGRLSWALEWLNQRYQGFTRIPQAARIDSTPQTISNIVVRRIKNPKYELVKRLAEDMGLPVRFLLEGMMDSAADELAKTIAKMPDEFRTRLIVPEKALRPYILTGLQLAVQAFDAQLSPEILKSCFETAKMLQK